MADHHLADVSPLTHEGQSLSDLLQRIDARNDGDDAPIFEERDHRRQQVASGYSLPDANLAQVNGMERLVVHQFGQVQFFAGLEGVARQLQVTAGGREAVQPPLHAIAR